MDRAYTEYLARHGQREQAAEAKRARLQKTPRGLDGELVEPEEGDTAAPLDIQAPVHQVCSLVQEHFRQPLVERTACS